MTTERPPITKDQCVKQGREHWRKLEGNRSYAGTPDVDTALGALAFAWYESGGSFGSHQPDDAETFDKFLSKLDDIAPEMRLMQPRSSEPLKMPRLWTNPLTGQPLPPPKGPDERSILAKTEPELLGLLAEMEARPYATVKKLRDAEAKRLRQAAVKYGDAEHRANVFANGASESEKAKFVRDYPNLVETYKRETEPIQLPFGNNKNLTIAGRLSRSPRLHAILSRADEIVHVWNEQERERLRAAKALAEQELKRLESATT